MTVSYFCHEWKEEDEVEELAVTTARAAHETVLNKASTRRAEMEVSNREGTASTITKKSLPQGARDAHCDIKEREPAPSAKSSAIKSKSRKEAILTRTKATKVTIDNAKAIARRRCGSERRSGGEEGR